MSINRAIISGNLTRDPDVRTTLNGNTVLSFSVAVNERRKDAQTGEWKDYPNYIDCTMFGARAESLARYLSRGTRICLEGSLHWSSWEKDGQKRSKIEIIVSEVVFMSRNDGQGAQQPPAVDAPAQQPVQGWGNAYRNVQSGQSAQQQQPDAGGFYADADIPF